jgi:hypothetical protein
MSRRKAAIGSLLPRSRAHYTRDPYANSVSLSRRTFKEREDKPSQLNRLGTA